MTLVVAVSGGIDSVVLLHMLCKGQEEGEKGEEHYVVAHVDHGIRDDSRDDAIFVERLAVHYGLQYESTQLRLGARASEESARDARYRFLNEVKNRYKAEAIVTAHHQDDVLETMIINLIRGTGWRGLCSLREHGEMRRPLLAMSKAEIIQYALVHGLAWRDDSTNDDPRYLRNYVRQTLLRGVSPVERQALLRLYHDQVAIASEVEVELARLVELAGAGDGLRRYWLIMVGQSMAGELISAWQQQRFETQSLRRLWHFACTARPGKKIVESGRVFVVTARDLIVSSPHI